MFFETPCAGVPVIWYNCPRKTQKARKKYFVYSVLFVEENHTDSKPSLNLVKCSYGKEKQCYSTPAVSAQK